MIKKYDRKRKKLRENLSIGEKRIKNKEEKCPKKILQSVQNISYFNKDTFFTIRKKTNHQKYKILLDKKPICRTVQMFLKIRTFCFKIKLFIMVAMLLLRRTCKLQIILVSIDRFVEYLLVAMLLLGSCCCMSQCLLKKQQIILFVFLSVSLIFFKSQKKKKKNQTKFRAQKLQGSETSGSRNFKGQKLQGSETSRLRNFKAQKLQSSETSRIRNFRDQ